MVSNIIIVLQFDIYEVYHKETAGSQNKVVQKQFMEGTGLDATGDCSL